METKRKKSFCDKLLKFSLTLAVLLMSFSFFYYLVIFVPSLEKMKFDYQRKENIQENIISRESMESGKKELQRECILNARESYLEVFEMAIVGCNEYEDLESKSDCFDDLVSEVKMGLEEDIEKCKEENPIE